jgi:hypothetical protein
MHATPNPMVVYVIAHDHKSQKLQQVKSQTTGDEKKPNPNLSAF